MWYIQPFPINSQKVKMLRGLTGILKKKLLKWLERTFPQTPIPSHK